MIEPILAFVVGSIGWLLAEYFIHKHFGHAKKPQRTAFGREHTKHHALGNYFAPTSWKVRTAVIVLIVFMVIGVPIAGWILGTSFAVGFVITYATYEIVHRRAHTHPPRGWYGRWYRMHHFHHHFHDPKSNHGVTTSIGDRLFRTKTVPTCIRVPEKLAMEWLVDPNTGDVFDAYRADYELVRLKSRAPVSAAA